MSQEDSNQLQFDDFPAGFFGDLLGDDMSGLFGDSPPANVDPQSDSIDPALLQHGTYGVPPALNHTPYTGDDTFGLLNTPDHGTPAAAVCTGIPFPEQGELSYPVVFDLEEHLASLDQIQLPQYTPIEASAADHEEAPQDSSSLFGASSPEQEGDPESQIPIGLESIGLILPAEAPLRPNETFPIATVIPSPLNASHEQGLVPGNNGDPSNYTEFPENQEITAGITKSLAPTTHLEIIRQIPVLQKMKDSPEELLIVYSVYEPLQPWGEFRYTTRGHLREDIIFDEESMQRFVRDHPNGERLNLRIEKHPYSFQCRYREPELIKCRSKLCDWDRVFKVGDHRVAIDEVTGRLAEDQKDDNDPYFAAGYLHLHCFERLIPVAPLVVFNILAPDNRRIYKKEPDCTRINKMGVSPASASAFTNWRIEAVEGYSVSVEWIPEKPLAYALWLSGMRKGRKRVRAPPGITSDDIAEKATARRGWGGKRCSGVSVATMRAMESQGLSHEMIASRNGKTGKKGVRSPSNLKKRERSNSNTTQTTEHTEESSSEYEEAKPVVHNRPAKKLKRNRSVFQIAEDLATPGHATLPFDLQQIQDMGQSNGPPALRSQTPAHLNIEQIHDVGQLMAAPIAPSKAERPPVQNSTFGNQYTNIDPNLGYLETYDSIDWSQFPLEGDADWNKENMDPALVESTWTLPPPPQELNNQFNPPAPTYTPLSNSQILEQQGWTLPTTQPPRKYYQPPLQPPAPHSMSSDRRSRRSGHKPSPITIPSARRPVPISVETPIEVPPPAPVPQFAAAMPNQAYRSLSPAPWTAVPTATTTTTTRRARPSPRPQRGGRRRPEPAATYTADEYHKRQRQRQERELLQRQLLLSKGRPAPPPPPPPPPHPPARQGWYTYAPTATTGVSEFTTLQPYPAQMAPGEFVSGVPDGTFEDEFSLFKGGGDVQPNSGSFLNGEQMRFMDSWFGGQGF